MRGDTNFNQVDLLSIGLRVNYDFVAFHSMWRIFLHISVLVRVEIIYPRPVRRHYHPKYALITLAPVRYLRSLVVRAVHRHRTGVGSIPAGGTYC